MHCIVLLQNVVQQLEYHDILSMHTLEATRVNMTKEQHTSRETRKSQDMKQGQIPLLFTLRSLILPECGILGNPFLLWLINDLHYVLFLELSVMAQQ